MAYDSFRSLAVRIIQKGMTCSVSRDISGDISNIYTFLGSEQDTNLTFEFKCIQLPIKVNERGQFDELFANKEVIIAKSMILLAPNDTITQSGVNTFEIDDIITCINDKVIVKSIKTINPNNEAKPILSYLLCEVA